jgi:hypothetical protein
MDLFTQDEIKRLRAILNPRRERFPFPEAMQRWAAEVLKLEPEFGSVGPEHFVWRGSDDPVATMILLPRRPIVARRKRPIVARRKRLGRRPDDTSYFDALLLAVIYHEYTGKAPTRVWDPVGRKEASPSFQFAAAAFSMLRRPTPERALREVCKRWARSRDFYKTTMRRLLFDAPARRPDAVQQRAENVAAVEQDAHDAACTQTVAEMAAKELALRIEILRRRDAGDDYTELLRSLRTIYSQRMEALHTMKEAGD